MSAAWSGALPSALRLNEDAQPDLEYTSSFRNQVLCLAEGKTEEQWEDEWMSEAEQLGLDLPSLLSSPPTAAIKRQSALTGSSRLSRRSESLNSTASQSTDLTSNFSEVSKDTYFANRKRRSGASLSLHDYDVFLARGTTDESRNVISFSPLCGPTDSALSLPLYSPETPMRRPSRVLKGLSRLRLHRLDQAWPSNESCPHCPRHTLIQRRAVHKLPCGHRLCTAALRSTIKSAMESKADAVPGCCGLPVSGTLVQHVMTREEQDTFLHKLEQWDDTVSLASSVPNETGGRPCSSSARRAVTPEVAPEIRERSATTITPEALFEISKRADYQLVYEEQTALQDRFLAWSGDERTKLIASHEQQRRNLRTLHESLEDEKIEYNARAIADAEDRQVNAEADLRNVHAQEKRDNATALKHMEAYCAGEYGSGEAHHRLVTEQDLTELAKARRIRDTMDSKHESAINILRGEQARRMTLRHQRQNRELQDLRRAQRMEDLCHERACTVELQALEAYVKEKQAKLSVRWAIQDAMFLKKLEAETGVVSGWRLPPLQWPQQLEDRLQSSPDLAPDNKRPSTV